MGGEGRGGERMGPVEASAEEKHGQSWDTQFLFATAST